MTILIQCGVDAAHVRPTLDRAVFKPRVDSNQLRVHAIALDSKNGIAIPVPPQSFLAVGA
jgi:hypothetical protein